MVTDGYTRTERPRTRLAGPACSDHVQFALAASSLPSSFGTIEGVVRI